MGSDRDDQSALIFAISAGLRGRKTTAFRDNKVAYAELRRLSQLSRYAVHQAIGKGYSSGERVTLRLARSRSNASAGYTPRGRLKPRQKYEALWPLHPCHGPLVGVSP